MRKFFFLIVFISASFMTFAQELVYDVNFALASNGSSATASSGNADAAIDGNVGTRWESVSADPQVWTLDLGQARIFNTIEIVWEGAYAKTFDIDLSNDGETWTNAKQVVNQTLEGFPYTQTLEITQSTARYVRFTGTERGTGYGYSFWEFRVYMPGVSTLTSITLEAPAIAKIGEGAALVVKAFDQNTKEMAAEISYEVTPADAGAVVNGVYMPAKIGSASIVAYSGNIQSAPITVFGYEGDNLALSTDIASNNKVIAQSEFAPNGTDAFFAVDGNDGSVYQGSATNGTADTDEARTFDAWFVVDLGANYSIDLITIHFEGACAQDYHVDFSENNTDWVLGYDHIGDAGINGRTDMLSTQLDNNNKVRYVRFWSTKAGTPWGMKIYEFQVFGREYVASDDTEKPVMGNATLVSKTWNSAIIAVDATDNDEVAKYHVVDAAKSIDLKLAATEGKITVTGLTAGTKYNFVITALDAAQNESENSKTVTVSTDTRVTVPTAAAPVPAWPAAQVKSIYSDAYTFAPASLNSYNEDWWNNPNMTEEAIGEDHYLHYDLYRDGMIGAQMAETSVATMEKFHIDVFASASGSVTFRLICAGDAEAINQTKQTLNLVGGQWNSFDFDLADFNAAHNWTRLFQYAIEGYQAGGLVGEHISVDNMYFYRTSALVDNEAPTALTGSQASATYFSVTLALSAEDNSGAVLYDVLNGELVVAQGGGASGATVNVTVPSLTPNTAYTFSVVAKDEAGNLSEPIQVAAQTLAGAPAPAPRPSFLNKEAVAVFCDELDGNPAINIGRWGQSTVAAVAQLAAGDNVFYCTNMNYLGWELAPSVNADEMEYVHVDFYATEMTSVQLTPISPGHEGVYTVQLTPNAWTSVDVPLSAYDGKSIEWSNIFQFKFMAAAPAGKDLFIDNVYFFKNIGQGAGVENVETAQKAQKMLVNGQLIILKNGIRYNVAGQIVK